MRLYWLCSLLFVLASGVLFGSPTAGATPGERLEAVAILSLYDAASAFDLPSAPQDDTEVPDASDASGAGIADEDESDGDGDVVGHGGAPNVLRPPDFRAVYAPFLRLQPQRGHSRGREHPPRA